MWPILMRVFSHDDDGVRSFVRSFVTKHTHTHMKMTEINAHAERSSTTTTQRRQSLSSTKFTRIEQRVCVLFVSSVERSTRKLVALSRKTSRPPIQNIRRTFCDVPAGGKNTS